MKTENMLQNVLMMVAISAAMLIIAIAINNRYFSAKYDAMLQQYVSQVNTVGTVDIKHIIAVKLTELSKQSISKGYSKEVLINKMSSFAKSLTKVCQQVGREHHVNLITSSALIYNDSNDYTKEVMHILGMKQDPLNLYSTLNATLKDKQR